VKKSFGNKKDAEVFAASVSGEVATWQHDTMGTMYEVIYVPASPRKVDWNEFRIKLQRNRIIIDRDELAKIEAELAALKVTDEVTLETYNVLTRKMEFWQGFLKTDLAHLERLLGG
jgi:hypothetical protein